MILQEFFDKYNNKGIDFDGYYGFQCMDLAEQYNKEVVGAPKFGGNAIDCWTEYPFDFYDKITNSPDNFPLPGDVIIWSQGVGQFGHIAICSDANTNTFTSFDQNWPIGSVCHFQPHNYNNVLGWLRPKPAIIPQPIPTEPTINDQTKIDMGEGFGLQEVQQVRSELHDQVNQIGSLIKQLADCQNTPVPPQTPPNPPPDWQDQSFTNPLAKLLFSIAKALG